MTQLQRLAFERIEIEPMKLLSVVNLLLEQRDLIDALNVEDGEGFENE